MAMVRLVGIVALLLSLVGCKDAEEIQEEIRGYGASVKVNLGDSSPLQSGFYSIALLKADGSDDERFPEPKRIDYVDGDQSFVVALESSAFETVNAIQTRLYIEAFAGEGQTKSVAVGSRSISLTNGEDTETTISLISAPAPVNNRTIELSYQTQGTWREQAATTGSDATPANQGRLANITFVNEPPAGFSYHLWRLITDGQDITSVRHMGVLDSSLGVANVFNPSELDVDGDTPFYLLDNLVFAISAESPEDTGYLEKPLGWILWRSLAVNEALQSFITTGHALVGSVEKDIEVAISHSGYAAAASTSGAAQSHGEHVANCLIGDDHPHVEGLDFNGNNRAETTGSCSNLGLFSLQSDLVDHLAELEDLDVDVDLGVEVLSVIGGCSAAIEDVSSLAAHQASGVARVLEAMDAFQEASQLANSGDDETGAALRASVEALYGQPYTPDLDPAEYGLDCIHDTLERLTTTSFVPYSP